MLGLIFAVGLALGGVGTRALSAQPPTVRFAELLRTELAGLSNKQAIIGVAEIAAGARPGRHYHPGDEFFYVLDGSVTWEEDGKPPAVLHAGQIGHQPAGRVAQVTNITRPVKALVILIHEKGQPVRIAVE